MSFAGGSPVLSPETPFVPAPFNPTSLIVTAGGFWRADMNVTQTGGDTTQWNDQSSFGNNLTKQFLNTNDGSKAVFSSNSFNTSFSGITFTGGTQVSLSEAANTNIFPVTTTASIFALFEFTGTPSGFPNDRMVALQCSSTNNIYNTPGFLLGSDTNSMQFYSSAEQGNGGSELSGSVATPYLLGGVFTGTVGQKWLNGAKQGTDTTFSSNLGDTSVRFVVGMPSNNGSAAGFTVAFWGITQKAMNSTDWTNLKNWCNAHWGTSF